MDEHLDPDRLQSILDGAERLKPGEYAMSDAIEQVAAIRAMRLPAAPADAHARIATQLESVFKAPTKSGPWWSIGAWFGAGPFPRPMAQRLAAGALMFAAAGSGASGATGISPLEAVSAIGDVGGSIVSNLFPRGGAPFLAPDLEPTSTASVVASVSATPTSTPSGSPTPPGSQSAASVTQTSPATSTTPGTSPTAAGTPVPGSSATAASSTGANPTATAPSTGGSATPPAATSTGGSATSPAATSTPQGPAATSTATATPPVAATATPAVPTPTVQAPTATPPAPAATSAPTVTNTPVPTPSPTGTAVPDQVQTYQVANAGSVTLRVSGGVLSIVTIATSPGWTATIDQANPPEVDFRSGEERYRFAAELDNGAIKTLVEAR